MLRPQTLFARTALAMAIALLAFVLLAGFLVFRYILYPVGQQAADDLAALMVLSAQTWAELPPETRPDFVEELKQNHQLLLLETAPAEGMEPLGYTPPYLHFLGDSLSRRLGQTIALHQVPGMADWFWTRIQVADRDLYLGFSHDRIGARPPQVLLGILFGAGFFILFTALFLVRLINRPLAQLDAGVRQLGQRGFSDSLPEEGPRELAVLARTFNQLSREIRQLLDNRTTLLGGISHDLRTPLARLGIALELLEGREDDQLLKQMRRDLEEMNQIISRTLELAGLIRLEQENEQKASVDSLLREIQAHYARQERRIRLHQAGECNPEVPVLPVRRILGNLLDNAFHYGTKKEVEVTLACSGTDVKICVLDSGPGIPDDELERVFQPFHRLEPSRSRATGGSGLGLAIVRQLADARGWKVTLENREKGGLAACLELRAAESSPPPSTPQA